MNIRETRIYDEIHTFTQKTKKMSRYLRVLLCVPIEALIIVSLGCGGCGGTSKIVDTDDKKEKGLSNTNTANNNSDEIKSSSDFDLGILKDSPVLPVEVANITEAYDHYILKVSEYESKYELYDGTKQQNIEIAIDEKLEISENQNYMLKYKLKENKLAKEYFFEVQILNSSNEIISKGIIPAVGEDNYESHDVLYPFNNGKGLIIWSEYPERLTVYIAEKNKFVIAGTIFNENKILTDFKISDDASDIICLFYDENEGKSYLDNHQLSNGKINKKWSKKTGGKQAHFSQFAGWLNPYIGNSTKIDLVTSSQDYIDHIEVYNLEGNLILASQISNCNYFESFDEGSNISYIGTAGETLQYYDKKGRLQIVNLKNLFSLDTTLNVTIIKFINTKNSIICQFSIYPKIINNEYKNGVLSGVGILPKSNIEKGKYFPIYKKSSLELIVKNDILYLLKGHRTLYPESIKKLKIPLTF